ncbi:helicase-exonuclease AddAB subunit AddA [uncultured Limosilactobacillus sp.]|uniref:helicase-exonuclease AddAB subunit AddA n=1 Tax=uncultured Limosilactobacillus sp. TaxID=2837629 RepID=UPI0025E1396B|nr:helicase-exonuclease AddAB subunit AddA [uncultured Limosilactobacillus sp.]
MSKFQPTPEQQRAINDRDRDILVSASAGSGKTAVLVDRVIKLLKENRHLNIDQMLLVTFTKEAAKNMRDRIRQRLVADSNDQHMKAQINRLAIANISTIHSFCEQVIKRYYYVIGLDPQYRLVTDETEQALLKEQVWNSLQEERFKTDYSKADPGDWHFSQLAENFADAKSNVGEGLQEVVEKLYQEANAQPNPDQWLDQAIKNYQFGKQPIVETDFYQKTLLPILELFFEQLIMDWQGVANEAAMRDFSDLAEVLNGDLTLIKDLQSALTTVSWDKLQAQVAGIKFGRLKARRFKDDPNGKAQYEELKNSRNELKKRLTTIQGKYFQYTEQQLRTKTAEALTMVEELVDVTKAFRRDYQQAKLDRHMLDFSDLEHYAYQILTNQSDAGKQVLNELQHHYQEILVDEYQDTNRLQDDLLNQLHDPQVNHLFMVGDVKQSIYRFRQADPTLFLDKYERYQHSNTADETIVLAENFRSMSNVTEFTNLVFTQLMDRTVGEMPYDEQAQLKFAAKWYDPAKTQPVPTELMIYDANADNDTVLNQDTNQQRYIKLPEGSDKYAGEVWMIAMRIRQMLDNHETIFDPDLGDERPIQPADIVILERTKSPNNRIVEQFGQLNIPVVVQDVQNYFKATEVRIMVSLLKVIDNPYQDIPLVAVLRSPIVGLTEPEMAYLRINHRYGNYYEALQAFEQRDADKIPTNEDVDVKLLHVKLSRFLEQLKEFKVTAQQESLVDLIWQIYQTTGYLDYVGGMPGGTQRQANLHALYERANTYEQSSFKGLYQFIHFIERMQKRNEDLGEAPVELATDAVNVMTIHGSKGLQFPIVFVIDLNHRFNSHDVAGNLVVEPHLGVGIRYLGDTPMKGEGQSLTADKVKVTYDLPQRTVVADAITRANRAEEMRLLYVALTRAEQRLILTGSVNEKNSKNNLKALGKQWSKAYQGFQTVLGPQLRLDSRSMLDWIGLSLARTSQFDPQGLKMETTIASGQPQLPNAKYTIQLWTANQVEAKLAQLRSERSATVMEDHGSQPLTVEERQFIHRVLTMKYAYQAATKTTAYQSVSAIRDIFANQDPDDAQMGRLTFNRAEVKDEGQYLQNSFDQPRFMQTGDQAPLPTEVGTATHLVFQMLDLTKGNVSAKQVQATIDQLVQERLIVNRRVAEQIDVEGIVKFYETELGQRILNHPMDLAREKPFSMLMDGDQLFKNLTNDDGQILIHGIIDGYLKEENGLELFDYKTDYLQPNDEHRLAEIVDRYQGQVNLYAAALQQMTGQPVRHRYLYLVKIGTLYEL